MDERLKNIFIMLSIKDARLDLISLELTNFVHSIKKTLKCDFKTAYYQMKKQLINYLEKADPENEYTLVLAIDNKREKVILKQIVLRGGYYEKKF